MYIVTLIFLVVLAIQFLLAIYALLVRKGIEKRFSHPLAEQIEAATALEQYSKIYRTVNLTVDAKINLPAYALDEFLLVNKNHMYHFDLFTTFYTLYQLELTKTEHKFARTLFIFQNILFFLQLSIFGLGLILQYSWAEYVLITALVIQIFSFMLGIIGFVLFEYVLSDTLDIARDILRLDEIEIYRAESLKNDLKYHVYEYPVDFILRIFRFLIP